MDLTNRQAKRIMEKLEVEFVKCKHHYRGFFTIDGKKLFPVHCSFGNKALPGDIPHRFRKSLKLSIAEFEILRSCKIGRSEYLEILNEKGIINS